MKLLVATLFTTFLSHIYTVEAAATTSAVCGNNYAWMRNSAFEYPCLVASKLSAVCTGGDYFVTAIDFSNTANNTYPLPTPETQNSCLCNTVVYMLYQACSMCQDGASDSWSRWSQAGCASTTYGYPNLIPEDTVVPGWAYIDPRAGTSFPYDQVMSQSSAPGSTGIAGASWISGSTSGSVVASVTSQGSSTATSSSNGPGATGSENNSGQDAKKSSPAPIIAGVVIALVVVVLAIGGFFWYRKRRQQGKPKELHIPIDDDKDLEERPSSEVAPRNLDAEATPFVPDPNATPEPVDPVTARRNNEKRRLQMAREQARLGLNTLPAPGSSSLNRSDTSAATASGSTTSAGPSERRRKGKPVTQASASSATPNTTSPPAPVEEEDDDELPPPNQSGMTEGDLDRLASRVVAMMGPSRTTPPARTSLDELPPMYERTPGST